MKSIRSLLAALFTSAGAAAPTSKPAPSIHADAMREMRLQWLTRPVPPADGPVQPDELTAVVMDWPIERAIVTVLASSAGDASIYTTGTFGIIGGIGHEGARTAARAFVECAGEHLALGVPTTDYSYPDRSHIRLFFVTRAGVRSVTFAADDVRKQGTDAYELFFRAQEVVTQLRLSVEKQSSAN